MNARFGPAEASEVGFSSGRRRAVASCVSACLLISSGCTGTSPESAAAVFILEEATIADIQGAFDAGALSCRELVQLYLDRIAAYDDDGPRLKSIITLNPRAIDAAEALDAERASTGPRGDLHCIPVLLKDNIDTDDMPTGNGLVILKDAIPPDDAHITRVLREAGALILGKASFGETLNPYHLSRGAGGSRGGSAVVVASNLAAVAVGTETSTAVRETASFSGVVGLRPTTGLISRDGMAPRNLSFDTAGPMARTVTDLAVLFTALAGPDPADPDSLNAIVYADHPVGSLAERFDYTQFLRGGALRRARLGVARDYFGGDPEIDALAEQAIATMKGLGAEIIDPVIFDGSFVRDVRTIADYRFKSDWEGYLATFGPEVPKTLAEFLEIYEPEVARSALPAEPSILSLLTRASVTATDRPAYTDLVENILPRNTQLKLDLFAAYNLDALVFPYHASFAPPVGGPTFSDDDPTYVPSGAVRSPSTLAGYSSVGFPGIVVPMGFGSQGLPMTITFLGRPYDEGKLIGYAYAYEQATMMRRPSPLVPPLPGEAIEN